MGALMHLPWKLIPFLCSLFVIMGWFDAIGMVEFAANLLIGIESEWAAVFVVGFGSTALAQIINNQPMTVLLSAVLNKVESMGIGSGPPPRWLKNAYFALTAAANLGGNGTMIASLAVILWRQILSEHEVKIGYIDFAKRGLSITALTVTAAILSHQSVMTLFAETPAVDPSTFCGLRHPQFPYRGGGACSRSCPTPNHLAPSWDLRRRHYPDSFSSEFVSSYEMAAGILMETGLDVGRGPFADDAPRPSIDYNLDDVHMTLDYFCCYDPFEAAAISEIAESFNWTATEVTFDELICTVNYDEHTFPGPNNVELMVMVDAASNEQLMSIIEQFEHRLTDQGLIVNVPRSDNIGFHVTLAHVDQTQMDLKSIIDRINDRVDWSSITMTMFDGGPVLNGFPEETDID